MGRWLADRQRLFLILTLLLAVSDILLIASNFASGRRAMHQEWLDAWARAQATIDLAIRERSSTMLMLARGYAADPEILRLVSEGRTALEAEGGGAGGPATAQARQALYDRVAPSWQRITAEFGVRQLHFHFGPGVLSFLRVHRPDRFGDRLDDIRHLIVDTIAQGTPRTGFEIGRAYSGLRGATPLVLAELAGGRGVVGALEAGISFDNLVQLLDEALGAGVAILLRKEEAANVIWDELIRERFAEDTGGCNCFIEARSRPEILDLARKGDIRAEVAPTPVKLTELAGRHYTVLQFPLRDYQASRDSSFPPVGHIVVWRDVSERIASFRHDQLIAIAVALSALIVFELLLYLGIRYVTGARDAAETGDRAKSNFLAMISHEMRTPLNAVIGFADFLRSGVAGPLQDKQTDYVESIFQSGSHLLRNIDRILQYQTIDSDARNNTREPFDLVAAVKEVLEQHAELADKRGVRLTTSLPSALEIKANPNAAKQALAEILTNAIAVSPGGGVVEIALSRRRGESILSVSDCGPGFPPQRLEALMRPFTKTQDAYHKADGVGMGLAIVRALMVRQRGRLQIENLPEGGARVSLYLP